MPACLPNGALQSAIAFLTVGDNRDGYGAKDHMIAHDQSPRRFRTSDNGMLRPGEARRRLDSAISLGFISVCPRQYWCNRTSSAGSPTTASRYAFFRPGLPRPVKTRVSTADYTDFADQCIALSAFSAKSAVQSPLSHPSAAVEPLPPHVFMPFRRAEKDCRNAVHMECCACVAQARTATYDNLSVFSGPQPQNPMENRKSACPVVRFVRKKRDSTCIGRGPAY